MFLCVIHNKYVFITGGVVIIIASGFAAPAGPAIVSVSSKSRLMNRRRAMKTHKERPFRLSLLEDSLLNF